MTPQTPPTDRPLTAGDVPLLREGDVLRIVPGRIGAGELRTFLRAWGEEIVEVEDTDESYCPDCYNFISRPVKGVEPVAYRWMWPGTNEWHYADYNLHPDAETVQPLYAALASPPVSERERELEGALRGAVPYLEALHSTCNGKEARGFVWGVIQKARALTAQPAGEGK